MEAVERIKEFCRRVGGRVRELGYSGYQVVSCLLPEAKRITLTNNSGLVTLTSEDDGLTEEFSIDGLAFKVSAREPKHGIFEKAGVGGYSAFVQGDFDRFEVSYRSGELNVSFWREEE